MPSTILRMEKRSPACRDEAKMAPGNRFRLNWLPFPHFFQFSRARAFSRFPPWCRNVIASMHSMVVFSYWKNGGFFLVLEYFFSTNILILIIVYKIQFESLYSCITWTAFHFVDRHCYQRGFREINSLYLIVKWFSIVYVSGLK